MFKGEHTMYMHYSGPLIMRLQYNMVSIMYNVPQLPAFPVVESGVGSKGALCILLAGGPWLT